MKENYRLIMLSAVLISMALFCGCSTNANKNGNSSVKMTSAAETSSQVSKEISQESQTSSVESSENTESLLTESVSENSENPEITESSEEASSESSLEESAEVSEESAPESEMPPEFSISEEIPEGYQFDDEHIVEDYHTATVFTSNQEFNQIFEKNKIDQDYNKALQNAATNSEMRAAAQDCAKSWRETVDTAYMALSQLISSKEEEFQKLQDSQSKWTDELQHKEEEFYTKASEEVQNGQAIGTETLLYADTAVLNYYKERTAILLEQIFRIQGENFKLSDYNLQGEES